MKALINVLTAARKEAIAKVKAAQVEVNKIDKMLSGVGAGAPKTAKAVKKGKKVAKPSKKTAGKGKKGAGRPKGSKNRAKGEPKTSTGKQGRPVQADSLRGRVTTILDNAGQPMTIPAIKDALAATGYDVSSEFMTAKITTCLTQAKAQRVARGVYASASYAPTAAPIETTETAVETEAAVVESTETAVS